MQHQRTCKGHVQQQQPRLLTAAELLLLKHQQQQQQQQRRFSSVSAAALMHTPAVSEWSTTCLVSNQSVEAWLLEKNCSIASAQGVMHAAKQRSKQVPLADR
jgi:hypothetical protein